MVAPKIIPIGPFGALFRDTTAQLDAWGKVTSPLITVPEIGLLSVAPESLLKLLSERLTEKEYGPMDALVTTAPHAVVAMVVAMVARKHDHFNIITWDRDLRVWCYIPFQLEALPV